MPDLDKGTQDTTQHQGHGTGDTGHDTGNKKSRTQNAGNENDTTKARHRDTGQKRMYI